MQRKDVLEIAGVVVAFLLWWTVMMAAVMGLA